MPGTSQAVSLTCAHLLSPPVSKQAVGRQTVGPVHLWRRGRTLQPFLLQICRVFPEADAAVAVWHQPRGEAGGGLRRGSDGAVWRGELQALLHRYGQTPTCCGATCCSCMSLAPWYLTFNLTVNIPMSLFIYQRPFLSWWELSRQQTPRQRRTSMPPRTASLLWAKWWGTGPSVPTSMKSCLTGCPGCLLMRTKRKRFTPLTSCVTSLKGKGLNVPRVSTFLVSPSCTRWRMYLCVISLQQQSYCSRPRQRKSSQDICHYCRWRLWRVCQKRGCLQQEVC